MTKYLKISATINKSTINIIINHINIHLSNISCDESRNITNNLEQNILDENYKTITYREKITK